MINRRTVLRIAGGAGLLAAAGSRRGRAADSDEVKIGSPLVISDAPFFIAEHKGYFKEQNLHVTLINLQTGPHMIAPLGTGQIDIAAAATSAGLYNAAAREIPLKITADKGSNLPGYGYTSLLVRKDLVESGKFKTMKDLKGLKVAEPGKGGSTGSTVNQALKSGGLKYDDVTHVFLPFPEMITALGNSAIDAAIVPEPFNTFGRQRGVGVRFPSDAFYPGQTVAVVVYGPDFIAKRKEVAQRFMVAYLKAVHYYLGAIRDGHFGGPHGPELIDILIRETRYKDPALYREVVPNGIDPNARVDVKSLETDVAFWREQKYLEADIPVEKVVDHSFIDAAVKIVGPYKPV